MKKRISLLILLISCNFLAAQSWYAIGAGTNGFILNAVELDPVTHDIYLGGSFTTAGGVSAKYIGRWNGFNYTQLGTDGADNPVRCLEIIDSTLWAGGEFNSIDSTLSPCIAVWDGSQWNSVGSGFEKTGLHTAAASVNAIAKYNGDIYAGGVFDFADSMQSLFISRWDGTGWNAVGLGIQGTSWVYDLQVFNGDLYVAGSFTGAGGVGNTANIAKWNGTAWSSVGGSANGPVYSLHVHNAELYAAGAFATIGGTAAAKIAKWNGFAWAPLGSGMNVDANSIATFNGDLYAGGIFTTAGGNPAQRIAKWDGSNWSAVGAGADGLVYDLETDSSMQRLYAAGTFNNIGGIPASHIAYLSPIVGVEKPLHSIPIVQVFPTPASKILYIRTESGWINGNGTLRITDLCGKIIYNQSNLSGTEWQLEVNDWTSGLYFIHLENGSTAWSGKTIID